MGVRIPPALPLHNNNIVFSTRKNKYQVLSLTHGMWSSNNLLVSTGAISFIFYSTYLLVATTRCRVGCLIYLLLIATLSIA